MRSFILLSTVLFLLLNNKSVKTIKLSTVRCENLHDACMRTKTFRSSCFLCLQAGVLYFHKMQYKCGNQKQYMCKNLQFYVCKVWCNISPATSRNFEKKRQNTKAKRWPHFLPLKASVVFLYSAYHPVQKHKCFFPRNWALSGVLKFFLCMASGPRCPVTSPPWRAIGGLSQQLLKVDLQTWSRAHWKGLWIHISNFEKWNLHGNLPSNQMQNSQATRCKWPNLRFFLWVSKECPWQPP